MRESDRIYPITQLYVLLLLQRVSPKQVVLEIARRSSNLAIKKAKVSSIYLQPSGQLEHYNLVGSKEVLSDI